MKYEFEIIQNGYTICPEKWGMQNETATFHRIYYVYGGEGYCTHRDKTIELKSGYVYLFPVMSSYTLWQNINSPLEVLWFHVEMKTRICLDLCIIDIEENSIIYSMLEILKRMTDIPEYFDEFITIFDILLGLVVEKVPFSIYTSKKMKRVIEYIDSNISNPELGVNILAKYAGMDRAYFSRVFKKTFNISPNQYICAKKMGSAALELTRGASVYQTAGMVGYRDEKSFSRAFKRYMEVTPTEYRKTRVINP